MNKANKYILLKDDFRCGYVFRHADLLNKNESDKAVLGGGYFEFDEVKHIVRLYGKSDDYGYPDKLEEHLKKIYHIVMDKLAEEYYWHFSEDEAEMPEDYVLVYRDMSGVEKIVNCYGSN